MAAELNDPAISKTLGNYGKEISLNLSPVITKYCMRTKDKLISSSGTL